MQILPYNDPWTIYSLALHTPLYRKRYTQALKKLISSNGILPAILDTACGIGFPSIDLYNDGFTDLSCSDASEEALQAIKEKINHQVYVFQSRWEELSERTRALFDVVLNVDNSLVYMDGWNDKPLAETLESIFERILIALVSFYKCLKPGGKLIVALTKKNSKGRPREEIIFPEINYKGQKIKAIWDVSFDWETRIKTCAIHTNFNNQENKVTIKSYIITLEELCNLFEKAGFINVHTVKVPGIRDNLCVGYKP